MTYRRKPTRSQVPGAALLAAGALLVLAGVALAALTEHGLASFQDAARRHGGQILDLGADAQPSGAYQGYMVRVSGPLRVVEAPLDVQFNQQASTPVLSRHVEMFQWHEIRAGGPPIYEQDWEDHPVDSSRFESGHGNPGTFPLHSRQFDAGRVSVGAFVLSPQIQQALPGSQAVAPDPRRLPANLAASFSLHHGALVTSAHPGHPRLGDLRVSWSAVPTGIVTVVARLDGNRLLPAAGTADGKGFDVEVGDRPLLAIYPDLPVPPEFVWPRRLLAFALVVLGIGLLLVRQRVARASYLALASGVALVCAVCGVLWLGQGAGMAAPWLAVAVAGTVAAVAVVRVRRAG